MTNAQLKRLINKIEVDKDGNVDIYLRLIGDLGLDETVLIEGYENTEEKDDKTALNCYNHTQGRRRASSCHQFGACQTGARDTRAKQEREAHPRWTCHQGEISASA